MKMVRSLVRMAAVPLLVPAAPGALQTQPQNHAPFCLPAPALPNGHFVMGTLPDGTSARYDHYIAWVCERPTGYSSEAWIFGFKELGSDAWKFVNGELSLTDAVARIAAMTSPNTTSEQAFTDAQVKAISPTAVVAVNGTSPTSSVYQTNSDGTLNSTPVPNASVAVGAPCYPGLRLVGTNYYSVKGLPNASQGGQQNLGDVYSVCVVSLPSIGVN